MVEALGGLITLVCAIWVGVDAARLGIRRGGLGGGFLDMGIFGWFLSVWLLFFLGFPLYLVARQRYLAEGRRRRVGIERSRADDSWEVPQSTWRPGEGAAWAPGQGRAAEHVAAPQLPPPGWYPDPELASSSRYWDGASWGARAPQVPPPR